MAELPDLTVFASILNHKFKGKQLEKLDVIVAKKINVSSAELKSKLEGQKLEKVARVGKTLQFHFGKSDILVLHLMLRGDLRDFMKIHGQRLKGLPQESSLNQKPSGVELHILLRSKSFMNKANS